MNLSLEPVVWAGYSRPMSANGASFEVGRGGVFYFFVLISAGGILAAAGLAAAGDWLWALALLGGGLSAAATCVWMPGVLTLDDAGIEIRRRRGSQRLLWSDIDRVVWVSADGIAALASDNWVLTLSGKTDGKNTTMILSGPMVKRQHEARQLLEARLSRRQ